MASPIINEDFMLLALKPVETVEPVGEVVARLHRGAAMLIIDAYDRKATRDQMIAAIVAGVELTDVVSRHIMLHNIKRFDELQGGVSKVDIEVAVDKTTKLIAHAVEQCAKMAALLKECPLDEDSVN